jgi:hypothetical protein
MEGDRQKAARYRTRAIEVRKIATSIAGSPSRKTLLQVADDYEQMARTLDVIADTDLSRN